MSLIINNIHFTEDMARTFLWLRFLHLRLLPLALGAATGFARSAPPKSFPPTVLNLQEYFAELDRWSTAAQSVEKHPELAASLRRQLPEAWRVKIGQEEFSVPTIWLRDLLRLVEANHDLAAHYAGEITWRLAEMRREAAALNEEQPALTPDAAAAALRRVLARREFRRVGPDTWLERLREALAEWWNNLWQRLAGAFKGHTRWLTILLSLFVLTVLALLAGWLVRIALGRQRASQLRLESPLVVEKRWQDWARQALAAANRADYRQAIRLAYWAAVYRLAEAGVWQVDESRTHREYLRLLPGSDRRRPALAAVTARFERTWYGGSRAQAEDFRELVAQLEDIGCSIRSTLQTASSSS
jgi:hypothetical protein